MKRFGGLEVTMAALFCAGAYACAAPEELPPEVIDAAEKYYFAASATGQTPTPPPTGSSTAVTPTPPPTGSSTAVTPTPPPTGSVVTPPPAVPTGLTPPTATVPPAAPPFGVPPPAALPEAELEELEPADAVPLEQWLNQ